VSAKTNGKEMPHNNDTEPIVKPGYGLDRMDPGPLSIMVSSHRDLRLLCDKLQIEGSRYRNLFNSRIYFKGGGNDKTRWSLTGPIIGAPYAVIILETLIALGVKQIIYLGLCGAVSPKIKIGDIIIPSGSLIDEGTSRHYQSVKSDFAEPSSALVEDLKLTATRMNFDYRYGLIWTTDAVFRETPERVVDYRNRDVLAVEMELSALFTVGKSYGVDMAGILVVSDDLSTLRWKPGFKTDDFKKGRTAVTDIIGEICKSQ
jgi:purine-nucleoside phosphorylase